MNTPELEEEKRRGPRNWGLEAIKGQEKVRRSSVDLRREIIDVGSIQRLIELRKQRRQRRAERAATPEPTPPPEPLEIEGPVEPETFLRAAVQGKMHIIEKFLTDGGSPDTCDEVASLAATGCPQPVPCHQVLQPCPTMPVGKGWDPWDRAGGTTRLGRGGCTCALMHHPVPQFHRTALHRSSLEGHVEILKKLLDSGATVDFRDRVRLDPASSCMLV
ncbi:hypothetical protein IHE44_0001563 [Lamprotornis superbus]|uniref:Uncharacterized protein n=1 Tax=Lamprotornis superbus TaxID=245042 RepID=A0A835NSR2_9PASS|nr:hypothetical protein IHE44_0001563 [Lamprotornis superbus]